MQSSTEPSWYILRHRHTPSATLRGNAKTKIEAFCHATGAALELFAPTIVSHTQRAGKIVKSERPLAFQYTFVHGTLPHIKQLCAMQYGFSFVIDHGSEQRYATLTPEQMEAFRLIAMAHRNTLPFYSLADIDLQSGDKVQIIEGSFPGLIGYYIPTPKSDSGTIVIQATSQLGSIVYNIKAKYVRVLEFAPHTSRPYDQIDAFVPRLYRAMRLWAASTPLDERAIADLSIFTRRMSRVQGLEPKLEGKLSILLWGATTILGQQEQAEQARTRYERRKAQLTAPATRALALLIEGVITRTPALLRDGATLLPFSSEVATTLTKSEAALAAEYTHHLPA